MYKMPLTSKDIVSLSQARASLTELCEEVRTKGTEKIITKNGGSVAALIDADRVDYYYHLLEREQIQFALLKEAISGLKDVKSKRTLTLPELRSRHGR